MPIILVVVVGMFLLSKMKIDDCDDPRGQAGIASVWGAVACAVLLAVLFLNGWL
jgi:hypothetical protein